MSDHYPYNTRGDHKKTRALGKDIDDRSESYGLIRALLWVGFIMTYKNQQNVDFEIQKFISATEQQYPEFKDLERY